MRLVEPRRPGGFNEYLPAEQIEFQRLVDITRGVYEKYGFSPIDTPDMELTEVLLAKGGGETEQEVYSFRRDGSNTNLTLRYDLTVPLARYVAEHESDLIFPFRRFHIGKVHRAERQQAGRFREFYQADVDVIGSDSPLVDAELPAVINEIFEQFGFGEFTIRLNNRLILSGFLEHLGLSKLSTEVLHAIDKVEKISEREFVSLLERLKIDDEKISELNKFINLTGNNEDKLTSLKGWGVKSSNFNEGVDKITTVIETLKTMGVPESRIRLDPKIVRGLDYYTGTVYETILNDYPQVGSVCSGGRYDNLASYYTKTNLPGVGISIGLTRLFYAMKQVGAIKAESFSPAKVIVLPIAAAQNDFAIRVATKLRQQNIATVLYTEPDNMGKKMRYASRMGFKYAVIIGASEVEQNEVSLKNLTERRDETVSFDELVSRLV